ncbi:MAG: precorrin-3B C(17)-methyltransferase, partial [Alphaproteobacteria bacterium]
MSESVAIVVLGPGGRTAAEVAKRAIEGGEIHGFRSRIDAAEILFDDIAAHLRSLFTGGVPIIGICAAGILIRALAPVLDDKRGEKAVIALAEDGSAVVPLLGGHHGANDLARRLADAFGIAPALTTAGDLRFGIALDAPPPG